MTQQSSPSFLARHGRGLWTLTTACFVLAAVTCAVVNLAVSRTLSWALYPLLSIGFAWLILTPFLLLGRGRVQYAIGAVCLFIFPFLLLLDGIAPVHGWAKAVGFPIAGISVLYIAAVYAIVRHARWNWWVRAGALIAGAAPVSLVSRLAVSRFIHLPMGWTGWISPIACLGVAAVLILLGTGQKRVPS